MKYMEYFLPVINDCQKKYNEKALAYGEYWKDMSTSQLDRRFDTEQREYEESDVDEARYRETVDRINVLLMLAYHLRKRVQWGSTRDFVRVKEDEKHI